MGVLVYGHNIWPVLYPYFTPSWIDLFLQMFNEKLNEPSHDIYWT